MDMVDSTKPNSTPVPYYARINGENFKWLVNSVYKYVMDFIQHNLSWMKETGGLKTWLIKIPDAVVSISERVGPATHFSGKVINVVAEFLMPIKKLGDCASPIVGFAEVAFKFQAMFEPSKTEVNYVVKDADGNSGIAQFSLHYLEQKANKILSVADWSLSVTGCASYFWKSNHTSDEKFPYAPIATWSARYMSLKGLYSEGRFLYETLWVGPDPETRMSFRKKKYVVLENPKAAWQEVAGSMLKISFSIACLSADVLKTLAVTESQSPWLDTAIFCAGVAPTFIAPVALRYWPKMVVEPLNTAAASA
jgi:hypothetical protein